MFNTVFQHYEGSIDQLKGKSISSFYSLEDKNTGNVYLLWLETGPDNKWYRIFIDGWYCGVDEYGECMLQEDREDDVVVLDLTQKYKKSSIINASVQEQGEPDSHIVLSIYFENSKVELICKAGDGYCVLMHSKPCKY